MAGTGILALDMAAACGWAFAPKSALLEWPLTDLEWNASGKPDGIESGFEMFDGKKGNGRLFVVFESWVRGQIQLRNPGLVVFESRQGFQRQAYSSHVKRAMGMASTVERVCFELEVRCAEVPPSSVKKSWTDNGRATKDEMIEKAQERGFNVLDDNEADALAILNHVVLRTLANMRHAKAKAGD